MKISINSEALTWYKKELQVQPGEAIRFFVQYGGCSTVQKGFSLGVRIDTPITLGAMTTIDAISFYVEEEDLWYFDHHNLQITLPDKAEYPLVEYIS